jgi:hypothetical protein
MFCPFDTGIDALYGPLILRMLPVSVHRMVAKAFVSGSSRNSSMSDIGLKRSNFKRAELVTTVCVCQDDGVVGRDTV